MHIYERESHLSVLRELFHRTVEGRGDAALISGPVACGKTELLQAFADYAVQEGATVLAATGSAAEKALPLGVVSQLLHSAGLRPMPVSEMTGPPADDSAISEQHVPVIDGLWTELQELSADRPVVLCVDDLHHADRPSVQALRYLQRRLRRSGILLVCSEYGWFERSSTVSPAQLGQEPRSVQVRLGMLTADGVTEMIAEAFDRDRAQEYGDYFAANSGGNPLLVRALIADWLASASSPVAEPLPSPDPGEEFAYAVATCLRRGSATGLEVAQGIAIAGDASSAAFLARLLGLDEPTVSRSVCELTASGILERQRFRHPAASAAALGTLGEAARVDLHNRAAELLHHDGAPVRQVAAQLIAAGKSGGEWAILVLKEASRRALADDQVDFAIKCLELAATYCADVGDRMAIMSALVQIEWRTNPSAVAQYLTPLRSALFGGHLGDRDASLLIRYLLWHGRVDEAAETLKWLGGPDCTDDAQIATELRITHQWLYYSHPPLLTRIRNPVGLSEGEELSTGDNLRFQASSVLTTVLSQGASEDLLLSAEQVLQCTRLGDTTLESILAALLALVYADRPDLAAPWCEAFMREAAERGVSTWLAMLANTLADISIRQGNMPAAEHHARTALAQMSAQSWGVVIGSPVASLVVAMTAMGKHDEAAEQLRQVLPESLFETRFGLQYLHARGYHYLATDRALAALADFQRCGRLMTKWGLDLPALLPWRSGAAQAYLRLGRVTEARELIEQQLGRPGGRGHRTRGASLRLLAATLPAPERPRLLSEAVELLQACGSRLELAYALADLSAAHDSLGDVTRARVLAQRTMVVAKTCHAEVACEEMLPHRGGLKLAERIEVGPYANGMNVLSNAERRVAGLAALGHSNREISNNLCITVSTVEQHLTRIYRKLNVRSRTELPAKIRVDIA